MIDFCECTGMVGGVKGGVSKLMNNKYSLCPKISSENTDPLYMGILVGAVTGSIL